MNLKTLFEYLASRKGYKQLALSNLFFSIIATCFAYVDMKWESLIILLMANVGFHMQIGFFKYLLKFQRAFVRSQKTIYEFAKLMQWVFLGIYIFLGCIMIMVFPIVSILGPHWWMIFLWIMPSGWLIGALHGKKDIDLEMN